MIDKFNVHGTVHRQVCVLYNQRDATYTMFFIIISALHVYRWCGWVGTDS